MFFIVCKLCAQKSSSFYGFFFKVYTLFCKLYAHFKILKLNIRCVYFYCYEVNELKILIKRKIEPIPVRPITDVKIPIMYNIFFSFLKIANIPNAREIKPKGIKLNERRPITIDKIEKRLFFFGSTSFFIF